MFPIMSKCPHAMTTSQNDTCEETTQYSRPCGLEPTVCIYYYDLHNYIIYDISRYCWDVTAINNNKTHAFQIRQRSTPTPSTFQIPLTWYSTVLTLMKATIITKPLEYLLAEYQVFTGSLLEFIFGVTIQQLNVVVKYVWTELIKFICSFRTYRACQTLELVQVCLDLNEGTVLM